MTEKSNNCFEQQIDDPLEQVRGTIRTVRTTGTIFQSNTSGCLAINL